MSIVSNVHQIVEYDPKKSSPYEGQRLAKVIFKGRGEKKAEHASQCASIPKINELDVQSRLADFMPHLVKLCEETQDRIVRDLFLAGKDVVKDDELGMDSILAQLEREAAGTRVTKDRIGLWYDTALADALREAFTAKLGEGKAVAAVAQCRELFQTAAGRAPIPAARKAQLEKFYGYADIEADAEISAWLWDRITAAAGEDVNLADLL